MNSKKIYISGRAEGSYRTQNLIKVLLDNKYELFYNSIHFSFLSNAKGLKKIIRIILRLIDESFKRIYIIYNIYLCDILIQPAICNDFRFEINVAKFFNKTIIVDFYISIYDTMILDRKSYEIGSRKANYYYNLDLNSLKKADFVFFLNKTEANYYLFPFKINFNPSKHIILPLCVEETLKCKLNYYSNKNLTFNICWWGNYIPLHGLEVILEAMSILNNSGELNFHFHMFGNKNKLKETKYKNIIKNLGIQNNVTIENSFTFKNGKLSDFLKENCHLVLGNFGNSSKAKNVLVNKVIDGVAMKSPVLNGESLAPKDYFRNESIFYTENKPELISKKILEISRLSLDEVNSRVLKSYQVYEQNFSIDSFYDNLNHFFSTKL